MVKICKDCKHYRYMDTRAPLSTMDDYFKCEHPDYYRRNMVTGVVSYYTCANMRAGAPCGFKAELFEAR